MRARKYSQIAVAVLLIFSVSLSTGFIDYHNNFTLPENIKNSGSQSGYIHFSVDDCIDIFQDLTVNEQMYQSCFEQPKLKFVKELHEKYDAVFSFYCFYTWDIEKDGFTLSDATAAFSDEFESEADWLKFGFHAADCNSYKNQDSDEFKDYYEKTVDELTRITSDKNISTFLRLDRYTASSQDVSILHKKGGQGLFISTDQSKQSYDLSEDEKSICYKNDWYEDEIGMYYTPTDVSLENIESDSRFYDILESVYNHPQIIVFTHEWIMDDKNVEKYMLWFAQFANDANISFAFPEERINSN